MADSGLMRSERFAWSGRDWRLPVWLWLGLVTMFVSVLHIVIDFGVGLFDLHGTLSLTEATTLIANNGVSDELYARTLAHFSEEELVKLSVAIGMINTWNRLCIPFHAIHPMPAAKAA